MNKIGTLEEKSQGVGGYTVKSDHRTRNLRAKSCMRDMKGKKRNDFTGNMQMMWPEKDGHKIIS